MLAASANFNAEFGEQRQQTELLCRSFYLSLEDVVVLACNRVLSMFTMNVSLLVSLGAVSHARIDPRLLLPPQGASYGMGCQIGSLGSLRYADKAIQQV